MTSSTTSSQAGGGVAVKKPSEAGAGGGGGGGGGGVAPRVDLEPIYEGLRAGLTTEQWMRYKEGVSGFVMGRLSRAEFSQLIDPVITGPKQRLHNQLLLGMYYNAFRDPPPHDVAPWALASNKSTSALGPGGSRSGRNLNSEGADAKVDARLKVEVMALAPRDRRRIKEVPEQSEIEDILPHMLYEYHLAKQIKIPDPGPPASATPAALNNKTNWESEIKNRYTLPLACESGEFPDLDQIKMRILPICYEQGVIGGVGEHTAAFMNTAAEMFVKEVLSNVICRVRCNRAMTVKTDAFKRKMEILEEARGETGERTVLGMNDLRLSFALGDNYLTQLPLSLNKIMSGGFPRPEEYEVPGSTAAGTGGWDYGGGGGIGWEGGGLEERRELKGLLDECLAVGM
ncbi:transcriptional regulator of RNA polII, SAGA, subunit-domain-containing protein [Kalaharituber pfeilii]|nr:transcriptional regulator of RNA polII, SAGA, subunit-domain-containing protein [Kalaharituber pfeilii]